MRPHLVNHLGTLLICVLTWGLVSCASLQQELDPKVYYERTLLMEVEVDGGPAKEFRGVGVLPRGTQYKIRVSNPNRGKMDFLRFSTCHRERTYNSTGKGHTIYFTPSGIERSGSCLIKFEAYSIKGKHGWGILEMETENETLEAALLCNGSISRGPVTICQSRTGLVQEIRFSKAVSIPSQSKRCRITTKENADTIRFKIPARECVHLFRGPNGRLHKLSTIGTEGVLIPAGD